MVDAMPFEATIKEVISRLNNETEINISSAWVYGSYAKKTYGSLSDLDIMLVIDDTYYTKENSRNIRIFSRSALYEPDSMPMELDVHCCSELQFKEKSSTLIESVISDGYCIWRKNDELYRDCK